MATLVANQLRGTKCTGPGVTPISRLPLYPAECRPQQQEPHPVAELKTLGLFVVTALAEIVGCYLPYLWLREGKSIWLLVPGALSLALFAWLLSLHPTAAGRVYAAYGGVYVFMAILWLWTVDGIRPTGWDILGSAVALLGMAIIMFAPRSS
ncbi:hypothetical protein CLH61_01890 [Marinobacter profundi]|uniref:Uncharacterized protein n=1 Tax=Marinobacter profundi TaxID=2666256 RepID=A0A2G1UQQ2_9GAMM|nr:hypothetical protein CLH61_01890 [Marinobacter profundi]